VWESGIRSHYLQGGFWLNWSDAVREAGYHPNQLQGAYGEDILIAKLISLSREVGHFPTYAEICIKAGIDARFPASQTSKRLGTKPQLANKILNYCRSHDGFDDMLTFCTPIAVREAESDKSEEVADGSATNSDGGTKQGFVYMALLQLGRERRCKIGKAVLVQRRADQISIQLPEDLKLVHTIKTDDAYGIEEYWHRRFAPKSTKGEWFSPSRHDIDAFKRRKFM
jgi:hypothetical protein